MGKRAKDPIAEITGELASDEPTDDVESVPLVVPDYAPPVSSRFLLADVVPDVVELCRYVRREKSDASKLAESILARLGY